MSQRQNVVARAVSSGTVCGLACLLSVAGCTPATPEVENRRWTVMSTVATFTVPAAPAEAANAGERAVRESFASLEGQLSVFKPDSDIARLNAAGTNAVTVSALTRDVLACALRYADISGGCFDPTVGPLMALWGFRGGRAPERLPTDAEMAATRERIGYRRLTLDGNNVSLAVPGMRVDLGGIAKGYAVDAAYDELVRRGMHRFMIDLGGNLRVRGQSRPGRPWTIGVRNPFDREQLLGTLALPDGMAVATSGNYERFVTIGDRRYAHIIDPRTGRPVEGMAGVTVAAPTATATDGLSTGLFVAGVEEGLRILTAERGASALFVPDRQPIRIVVSPGMRALFTPEPEFASAVE